MEHTEASLDAMRALAAWASNTSQEFHPAAIDAFLDSADLSLVAHAMTTAATVVTREQPAPGSKRRIKIPDVCHEFGVTCTDPFGTYRSLGMRLAA